ncbi:MAG: septal ring lytic transglycosylase RlpA family protein [Verrucomicrobia bacterium]|nr:septal ring lytic transglycosylase RlpA family protein [Verrucomicrobiota bacterium]
MRDTRRNFNRDKATATSVLVTVLLLGWPSAHGDSSRPVNAGLGETVRVTTSAELGVASFYADRYQGNPTASGEIFDMHQLTAAHPRLAFGTRVKVTHLGNQRSVIVRINDRGPFLQGRIIDLSLAAAQELQMVRAGLAQVKVEILK